jgi:hypothetical protein
MTRERLVLEPYAAENPGVGRWLSALEDSRRRTIRSIEGVTPHIDRTPPDGANSIGTLLYHVAAIEADWLFTEILEGIEPWPKDLFPFDVREQDGRLTPVNGISLRHHL